MSAPSAPRGSASPLSTEIPPLEIPDRWIVDPPPPTRQARLKAVALWIAVLVILVVMIAAVGKIMPALTGRPARPVDVRVMLRIIEVTGLLRAATIERLSA